MNLHTDLKAAVSTLSFETRAFVDGTFVNAASGKTFPTVNPATGKIITNVASCDAEDVNRAVAAARRAFDSGSWSRMAPRQRKSILLKFADLIEAKLEELALLETLDAGKPINDTRNVDLPDSIATLRWHDEATDKIYDQMSSAPHDVVSMIVREPIGVVGAVIPWNFPLFVAMWKIGPALAGGNSLIIQPAELTSLSLLRVAQLASEAGIPDGVFNVLPGLGHEAGKAIGLHTDIDCVSFTGSGEVGRYFLEYSAKSNLKRIILECGGKSPAIVMNDVRDLTPVVENVAAGILFCMGENCSAGSRLIVQEGIKDRLLTELKTQFKEWKVGDPFDEGTRVGSMIEEKHMSKVLG
ncbi:MAG: aldehyde dehydrogenase family protein, partial [Alphaproteobacteria bacterium]|nr:aldehyde dehydrogenase family protein [Alphaproteobacteria bacterium]